jgi:hypothetical protein
MMTHRATGREYKFCDVTKWLNNATKLTVPFLEGCPLKCNAHLDRFYFGFGFFVIN